MQELHASIRSQLADSASSLRALAFHLIGGVEAEDCVQNTMVAALSQREPPRDLRPWLRRVLRNEVHARTRAGIRRRNRERTSAPSVVAAPPDESLDEQLARGELTEVLLEVVDGLGEPYRRTLRRRFLLEHSTAQIAADEECSPATIRWRVHEGLRRVRDELDERFDGRDKWRTTMALLAVGPVDGVTPLGGEGATQPMKTNPSTSTTATSTTGSGTLLALTFVGGAAAAVAFTVSGSSAEPPSAVAATQPEADAAEPVVARAAVEGADGPTIGARAAEAAGAAATDDESLNFVGGNAHDEDLGDVVMACIEEVQPAPGRFEIELDLLGVEGGGTPTISTLEITRGREAPCVDDVEMISPAEAEGVVRFDALTDCVRHRLADVTFFDDVSPDEPQKMVMVFSTGDEPLAEPVPGSALPEASAAVATLEPQAAIAALDLPQRGAAEADAITVVECLDYDCPFCRRAQVDLESLLESESDVALSVLHSPLAMHPNAALAARAAEAARAQGEFWAMHEALLDDPSLRDATALVATATQLGLDTEQFESDLWSDAIGQRVANMAAVCANGGANSTPSFFVGGDLVVGARGTEALRDAVEAERE